MKLHFIEDLENLQGEEKRVGTQPGWTSWLWWIYILFVSLWFFLMLE